MEFGLLLVDASEKIVECQHQTNEIKGEVKKYPIEKIVT